jgi:hypothetical protein
LEEHLLVVTVEMGLFLLWLLILRVNCTLRSMHYSCVSLRKVKVLGRSIELLNVNLALLDVGFWRVEGGGRVEHAWDASLGAIEPAWDVDGVSCVYESLTVIHQAVEVS